MCTLVLNPPKHGPTLHPRHYNTQRMGPFETEIAGAASVKVIEIDDEEEADLLTRLPEAVQFILDALARPSAKVLVHCAAGVSRSTSAVLAFLIATERLDVEPALKDVRARRGVVGPNMGFMRQLELFKSMGCALDPSHPAFKVFKLSQLQSRYESFGALESEEFHEVEDGRAASSAAASASSPATQSIYRCRKCRLVLANASHVIPAEMAGTGWSRWRLNKGRNSTYHVAAPKADSSSLFVLPLRWMEAEVTHQVEGKLNCPGCNARLGAFCWAGMQNTLGQWVTPAFQLHAKSLDEIQPAAQVPIRMPRAAPAAAAAVMPPSSAAARSLPAALENLKVDSEARPVLADRSGKRFTHVIFDVSRLRLKTSLSFFVYSTNLVPNDEKPNTHF